MTKKTPKISATRPKLRLPHFTVAHLPLLIIAVFQLIAAIFLIDTVFAANLLHTYQLVFLIAFLIYLQIFTAYKTFSKRTRDWSRRVFVVISLLLSLIYLSGAYYADHTIDFFRNITSPAEYETQEYSVVTLRSKYYDDIVDLQGCRIGFLSSNPHHQLASETLSQTIDFQEHTSENLTNIIIALNDGSVDAMAINTSQLETLEEHRSDFMSTAQVIFTFQIRYKSTYASAQLDILNDPFVVYISGSDARGPLTETARSDVNMLAVVNPRTHHILLINTPRDYYVQLHGTTGTRDKLTHAGFYGLDMSTATMQDLYGIQVDYTVKIGFDAVRDVVDALGGIDIYSDQAFTAWTDRSCYYTVGDMHLDGRCALAYARERRAYARGDRRRGENQQQVLAAIFNRALEPQNLVRYTSILDSLEGLFTTTFSYDQITDFAKYQLSNMQNWNIETLSVDGYNNMTTTYSLGDEVVFVIEPEQSTIDYAKARIQEVLSE